MSRINSNIPSLIARNNLAQANRDLDIRLERLATGLRINRGKDDPAGLIISERIRSEIAGVDQAVRNTERASSVIATAEASLAEISDLLSSIKALIVEAANTGAISDEEREANQLQINSAIDSITRISNSTSFGGLKLLNGELDYVLSGVSSTDITKAKINGANFLDNDSIQVDVEVVTSAQTAMLFLRGDYSDPALNGTLASTVSIRIQGTEGVQVLQFLSGTPLDDFVDAINSFTAATGVSASLINTGDLSSGVIFSSTGFGSKSFVSVERLGGPSDGGFWDTYELPSADQFGGFSFDLVDGGSITVTQGSRDEGRDVTAIVNGVLANGDGLNIRAENSASLSFELQLAQTFGTTNGSTTTFHIVAGGALFQIGGEVNASQQINVGIASVAAERLGGTLIGSTVEFLSSLKSGGSNDLRSRNFASASKVIESAIDEVSTLRGRLGALERNTLETNARSLQAAIENLTASNAVIRDADFALETSMLTRAQILASTGTSTLALANQQAQQVLQLLG